jgi:hypothetical protein
VENCLPTFPGYPNIPAKINERWGLERDRKQKLQKETVNPLEPSLDHLKATFFHHFPPIDKGHVVWKAESWRKTTVKKYSYGNR